MHIQIYSNDIEITQTLRADITTQVEKRAARHAERIDSITIRLKDLNGPKGGKDKQCTVEIIQANALANFASNTQASTLPNTPPIVVSKRSAELGKSISRALNRAIRTSVRQARKQNIVKAVRNRRDSFAKMMNKRRDESSVRTNDEVNDFDSSTAQ